MTRGEAVALGVAAAGHVLLFGVLSVGFLATPNPEKLEPQPIEVTLADEVALTSAAPEISSEAPAAKKSPVEAPLEADTAPQPAPEPEPLPPEPQPAPAPQPQPKPAPPKPAPPKPAPAKPQPAKPQPKPQPKPAPKAAPAKPSKPAPAARAKPAKAAPATPTRTAAAGKPKATKPAGAAPAKARGPVKPSGRLEGLDLGASDRPSPSKSNAAPAQRMSTQAAANIGSAIQRQVQPCADRQVSPGPGAEKIRAVVNLRLNRDGTLAAPPRIVGHDGVDDSNERYVRRVDDAVKAIFAGCSPLKNMPEELYDVPNGWKSFTLRYRLKS
nr:cell envelope biogenesis protein TolA [Sphingomonas xinjiangensis]